jgi:hypothetical protein
MARLQTIKAMCSRIELTRIGSDSPAKWTQPPPQWSSWRARHSSFLSVLHVAPTTRQTCTHERGDDCFDLLRYKLRLNNPYELSGFSLLLLNSCSLNDKTLFKRARCHRVLSPNRPQLLLYAQTAHIERVDRFTRCFDPLRSKNFGGLITTTHLYSPPRTIRQCPQP